MPNDPQSFAATLPALASVGGAPLYITGEDALACTVFNAAAGVTVTITGRILELGESRPKPFSQTLTPATDRSASVIRMPIGDGWLLNAQVIVSAGTPAIGQTFARLSLVRGTTSNALEQFTMAAGYVTTKMPLSYPGSGVLASVEGAGAMRSIAGATPAAGAEIAEVVPTGARWELLAFHALFTASGTVANRCPRLSIDDGTTRLAIVGTSINLVAGAIAELSWACGVGQPSQDIVQDQVMPLPVGMRLAAGFRARTVTTNIQAGDQFSIVQYLVREWLEGA